MNLTRTTRENLKRFAEEEEISLEDVYAQALEREGARLGHLFRTRPKEKLGVGRPVQTEREKLLKELTADLSGIYLKIQTRLGDAWAGSRFEQQAAEVASAIESKDLAALIRFRDSQPWVKRAETGDAATDSNLVSEGGS